MTVFNHSICALLATLALSCGGRVASDGDEGGEPEVPEEWVMWWEDTTYSFATEGPGLVWEVSQYTLNADGTLTVLDRTCEFPDGDGWVYAPGRWEVVGDDGSHVEFLSEDGSRPYTTSGEPSPFGPEHSWAIREYDPESGECTVNIESGPDAPESKGGPWTRGPTCIGGCGGGGLAECPEDEIKELKPCPEEL